VGLAAFDAVRTAGLLNGTTPSVEQVEAVLTRPLRIGGRTVRYRFARRRSGYLVSAIDTLAHEPIDQSSHRRFRDALTGIRGVGMKTASWVTRNWLDSDDVAVLDVHLLRAGCIMRLFPPDARVDRDYSTLEDLFIRFARAIGVRASRLDALIWRQMRSSGNLAVRAAARALKQLSASYMLSVAA
jgi:thermostable 8-oxoguanine DNA glycosylase